MSRDRWKTALKVLRQSCSASFIGHGTISHVAETRRSALFQGETSFSYTTVDIRMCKQHGVRKTVCLIWSELQNWATAYLIRCFQSRCRPQFLDVCLSQSCRCRLPQLADSGARRLRCACAAGPWTLPKPAVRLVKEHPGIVAQRPPRRHGSSQCKA